MEQLQALIDALTTSRDNPPAAVPDPAEYFAGLDDDTLTQMEATAVEAATAVQGQRLTDDTVAQLEVLADTLAAIRTETDRRDTEAQALASKAQELAARISPKTSPEPDAESAEEAAVDAAIEGEVIPAASRAPEAPAPRVPEPVTALARTRPRVDLSALRTGTSQATKAAQTASGPYPVTVTAASDLPGYPVNTQLRSVDDLSAAIQARFASFPIGSNGVEVRGGIALIQRQFPDSLMSSGNAKKDEDVIEYAADERRLPGGSLAAAQALGNSLTAAASDILNSQWCAVYEIDQTLCAPLETSDGFLDLPTIGVRPPGLVYAQNLDWWNVFDLATLKEFCDPCAGPKPCITLPCPDMTNADVCIEPFCIESCILKERANPSWYDYFVRRAMQAFRRWQNVQTIKKVLASPDLATPVVLDQMKTWGAGFEVMDMLSYIATYYRELYRMPFGATMEVVAPHWLKNVLRDDMARRTGCGCNDITDSQITAWFSNRGLRVQWIYDWQPLVKPTVSIVGPPPITLPWPPFGTAPGEPFVQPANLAPYYPDTVDVLVYPAGTFVAGRVEMFRMDGLYDAANLKQNKYTKVFFEDGVLVLQRCYRALRVQMPLCINGGNRVATLVQGDEDTDCPVLMQQPAIEAPIG